MLVRADMNVAKVQRFVGHHWREALNHFAILWPELMHNYLHVSVIAALLLCSYVYFFPGGRGWNENSRMDLTRAIVEEHTLRIDSFQTNTGDKSYFDGHYYCDKAPGLSFSAVPVWALARRAARAIYKDPSAGKSVHVRSGMYLATIATVGVPTVLAAVCLFVLSLKFRTSIGGAAFVALTFGLGTPMWCYATLFWGHATAAALLLFAFAAAVALRDSESRQLTFFLGFALGLAAGWATVTEYQSAPPAAILALLGIANCYRRSRNRIIPGSVGIVAGALICVLVLMGYQFAAFGSPFRLGYSYVANFSEQRTTLLGFGRPHLAILSKLLVGWFRGLLFISPVLALVPVGLRLMWKDVAARPSVVALALIPTYYLLLGSSFYYWDGGFTFGPRFVSPALPFLCLALGAIWTQTGNIGRVALSCLSAYAVTILLMAVSTSPIPDVSYTRPLQQYLWPAFRAGKLPIESSAWNLGRLAGLHGQATLVPLLFVWIVAAVAWAAVLGSARLRVHAADAAEKGRT
jgi:hypothetical protein